MEFAISQLLQSNNFQLFYSSKLTVYSSQQIFKNPQQNQTHHVCHFKLRGVQHPFCKTYGVYVYFFPYRQTKF
jgi:hypothetical protein